MLERLEIWIFYLLNFLNFSSKLPKWARSTNLEMSPCLPVSLRPPATLTGLIILLSWGNKYLKIGRLRGNAVFQGIKAIVIGGTRLQIGILVGQPVTGKGGHRLIITRRFFPLEYEAVGCYSRIRPGQCYPPFEESALKISRSLGSERVFIASQMEFQFHRNRVAILAIGGIKGISILTAGAIEQKVGIIQVFRVNVGYELPLLSLFLTKKHEAFDIVAMGIAPFQQNQIVLNGSFKTAGGFWTLPIENRIIQLTGGKHLIRILGTAPGFTAPTGVSYQVRGAVQNYFSLDQVGGHKGAGRNGGVLYPRHMSIATQAGNMAFRK